MRLNFLRPKSRPWPNVLVRAYRGFKRLRFTPAVLSVPALLVYGERHPKEASWAAIASLLLIFLSIDGDSITRE